MMGRVVNVWFLVVLFVSFEIAIILVTDHLIDSKSKQILAHRLEIFKAEYQAIEESYDKLSHLLYGETIQTEEVFRIYRQIASAGAEKRAELRQELYLLLKPSYDRLHTLKLRQLHFHLPDNTSFLRFHKPNRFGDNLSDVRYSVALVNRERRYVSGFEEGRIYNGFRHVFPMTDSDGVHLGSVEISLSYLSLKEDIEEMAGGYVQFVVSRAIVERKVWKEEQAFYRPSRIHSDYLEERHSLNDGYPAGFNQGMLDELNAIEAEAMHNNMTDALEFAQYVILDGQGYVRLFLPVSNVEGEVGASYIYSYLPTNVILKIRSDHWFVGAVLSLLNALLFYFIYLVLKANRTVKEQHLLLEEKHGMLEKELAEKQKLERENYQIMETLADRIDDEVAQRMELERQDREKEQLLIQQGKMAEMGYMIGAITHQWLQPLNVLMLLADMIPELADGSEKANKKLEEYAGNMQKQIRFMTETMDDFRNFYKTSKTKERFYPYEAAEFVLKLLRKKLEKDNVVVSIEKENSFAVLGYPNEFRQVLMNLFNNASDAIVEHKKLDGVVNVSCEHDGKNGVIRVRDNGGGIPEELLPDALFAAHQSTKGEKGTGIGLHLAKVIVEGNMQGKITARNIEGGAEFIIELPVAEEEWPS